MFGKNLFLSACLCWDSGLSVREIDQKFIFGRLIGVVSSCLNSVFWYLKVIRLHAILHNAAGAVRSHSGKGPRYCYMIGPGPNFCLLGHVTGLLFWLYVKLFFPSIFISVDFWSSISFFVVDIELTEKNIIKELRLFIDGFVQGFSFCPPKTINPNKKTTWNTSRLSEIAWSSGKLDYDKLFAVFYDLKVINAEMFVERLEMCRLLTRLIGRDAENLDDYGCPKIQHLVKTSSSWICSSYPFQHKTKLYCAKRKAKMYGDRAMQHL